jgi:hypothetical protein
LSCLQYSTTRWKTHREKKIVNRTSKDKGLTTVELFIVIAILGILITVSVLGVRKILSEQDAAEQGSAPIASIKDVSANVPFDDGSYVQLEGSSDKITSSDQYLLSCPVEELRSPLPAVDELATRLVEHQMLVVLWHTSDGLTTDGFAIASARTPEKLEADREFIDAQLKELRLACLTGK